MLVVDEAVESSESESDGEMGYDMLGADMLGSGSSDGDSDGGEPAGGEIDAEDGSDVDEAAGEKEARPAVRLSRAALRAGHSVAGAVRAAGRNTPGMPPGGLFPCVRCATAWGGLLLLRPSPDKG